MRETKIMTLLAGGAIAGMASALLIAAQPVQAAEAVKRAPAPQVDEVSNAGRAAGTRATAIFAGGCFWGVEGVFSHVKGVIASESGYAGGPANIRVSYDSVGSGRTGYAEAVKVTYDPSQVSYGTLLRIFFSVITDPTTLNYQGPDHGTQYRSALFPQSAEQDKVARAYLAQLDKAKLWDDPIVTKVEATGRYQTAEGYHQDFFEKNPNHGYIRRWDAPKLAAFMEMYPQLYKAKPAA